MKFLKRVVLSSSILCLTLTPVAAHALCTDPPGVKAQIIYNSTHNVFQGCRADGEWVSLVGGSGSSVGGGGGGGDNLGDHTAGQNLQMGTHSITGTGGMARGTFTGSGANVTNLNAGNIASGTLATARLGSGTANAGTYLRGNSTWGAASGDNLGNHTATQNISMGTYNITGTGIMTRGTFTGAGASVTSLNASNISSGTIAAARLGSGTPSVNTFLRGNSTWASVSGDNLGNHTATQNISMGTYNITGTGTMTRGAFTGSGAGTTALNASNISSGTIAAARLGSGTANGSTFLRGNNTWGAVPGDNLGNHTATEYFYLGSHKIIGTGNMTMNQFHGSSGAGLTNLNANNITTYLFGANRLGSDVGAGKFLRGDNRWAVPSLLPVCATGEKLVSNGTGWQCF